MYHISLINADRLAHFRTLTEAYFNFSAIQNETWLSEVP